MKVMKISLYKDGSVPVFPGSTGIFIEDINYGIDGGLYAELLENRNFEAKFVHGCIGNYVVKADGAYAWDAYPADAPVAVKLKDDRPLFSENPHYLRVVTERDGCGVSNRAYDGIFLK